MSEDRVIYPPRLNPDGETREERNPANCILTVTALIAAALAMYTLSVAWYAWTTKDAGKLYLVLPGWVLGPPIWFWCDYFLVYRRYGDPKAFESYKHSHQVSLAVWAGVALLLAALATSDHMKPKDEIKGANSQCEGGAGAAPKSQ